MQPITSDLSSILQLNQFAFQVDSPKLVPAAGNLDQKLLNDIAAVTSPVSNAGMPFDMAMNDIASYKDVISTAQDSISKMRSDGMEIKDIIAQAQQGNVSQELLDKMQAEVDAKILDISIIKEAADSEGSSAFSIDIPDTQALMGMSGGGGAASNVTSYSYDINFDIDGVSFEGSANIAVGKGENGAFTFAFDVSLNYDLSGLTTEGITSENAPNIIDDFLSTLDEKEGTLVNANKLIDSVFEKIFENMNATNPGDSVSGFNSSSFIRQQIVQQSSMTLDSIMMNQMPSIAYNLL